MYARATHSHTNRLQRYKKKLTYTIVYAIFLHFSLKILLFHLFLRPKAGCANTPATTPAIKTIIPTTINRIFIFIPFVVFKMCCKDTKKILYMQEKKIFLNLAHSDVSRLFFSPFGGKAKTYLENLSPTKPLLTSPLIRSKCLNTGGVGFKS